MLTRGQMTTEEFYFGIAAGLKLIGNQNPGKADRQRIYGEAYHLAQEMLAFVTEKHHEHGGSVDDE